MTSIVIAYIHRYNRYITFSIFSTYIEWELHVKSRDHGENFLRQRVVSAADPQDPAADLFFFVPAGRL